MFHPTALKPGRVGEVSPAMSDPFQAKPPPLYRAIPILEPAEEPPIPDALRLPVPPPPAPPAGSPQVLRILAAAVSVPVWLFGALVLTVGLAVLAALPVLQFLSLGYLLEAGGRVARTGRLRDGFIGVRQAALPGALVLGGWLLLLPLRLLAALAQAAQVIDPDGRAAHGWRIALLVLISLAALLILGLAFLLRDALWRRLAALRLPYYFGLGIRGFAGAFAWLALPVSLLALGTLPAPAAPLAGLLGAVLLAVVLLYLPFLQTRLAKTNRLSAAFELRGVRADFARAPWAHAFAFAATLLFALPLYLLKIEMIPREAAWLPGLAFVAFIFPARLLTGWALARAARRPAPRHWLFRWTGRLPLLPAAALYVLVVFFTQYTSWNGVWSLYEQHAFLLPVPFFGL
jgi:hypothetical protein